MWHRRCVVGTQFRPRLSEEEKALSTRRQRCWSCPCHRSSQNTTAEMLPLLASLCLALAGSASAVELKTNCTVDEATCIASAMKTIVLSGKRMCCPNAANFEINADVCTCVEFRIEEPCHRNAGCSGVRTSGKVTDSNGEIRCCQPGYVMNHVASTYVNGQLMDVCTCTLERAGPGGGVLSQILGLNNRGGVAVQAANPAARDFLLTQMGAMPPLDAAATPLNITELREEWRRLGHRWRQAGRRLAQGTRDWAHNFSRSMSNVGLEFARSMSDVLHRTVQSSLGPVHRAVNGMTQTFFNSFPSV